MKNCKLSMIAALLAALAALAACSESYPGINYEVENPLVNGETPDSSTLVPLYVYVNRQSFFSVTATRGTGPFNPITDLKDDLGNPVDPTEAEELRYYNTPFHILAFRDGVYASTGSSYPAELANEPNMTWTLMATNGGTKDESKMNCLVDGEDYSYGLQSTLDEKTGLMPSPKGLNQPQLYYGSYQDVGYNFFAYAIDGAKVTAHREPSSFWYDLEIDGTQDIMCGYAPKLTEAVLDERYSNLNLTEAERKKVLNIGNYSTYAAHRNIDPYVNLHHQLSRLRFRACAGDETANYITIDAIYVTCPTTGRLVVADKTPGNVGFYVDKSKEGKLYLHEEAQVLEGEDGKKYLADCEMMQPGQYKVDWKPEYKKADGTKVDISQREFTRIGGDIMLPSQQEYVVTIEATQTRDGQEKKIVSTYRVTPPEKEENQGDDTVDEDGNTVKSYWFKPARYYTISLVVYGLQPIKVYANVEGWVEDDSVILIDPDDAETEIVYDN